MPVINVIVKNKIARAEDPSAFIVCGNSDYVIEFEFDDEWSAYDAKTARFKWNGLVEEIVFTKNQCKVPIINDSIFVEVGVFAGNLQTTTGAYINAKKSILCGSEKRHEPDPDVYNQLMQLIRELQVDGVTHEQIEMAVAAYLTENPVEGGVSFETGNALELVNGILDVKTTDTAEQDNTLPITSAGVYTVVGNIGAILDTI